METIIAINLFVLCLAATVVPISLLLICINDAMVAYAKKREQDQIDDSIPTT